MIPAQTTVAETLKQVFTKLNAAIPTQNDGSTLLTSWTKLLGGSGRTEFDVLDSMSQILSALTKLEYQLRTSKLIDDVTRESALSTTSTFKAFFSFNNFLQPAAVFKGHCTPNLIGALGMIGLGIKEEFSEPKLSSDDSSVIKASLEEIKKLLKEEGIPVDLRVNLEKHVDNISWWLARPDIMSLQDIFEKVGSACVVANQIESRMASQGEVKRTTGSKIRTQMGVIIEKIASVVGFGVKNAENIEKLNQTITKMLN